MNYFTLNHFDEATGEVFSQDYRWYYNQECIELEANAGKEELPDWIFKEELEDIFSLSNWMYEQAKESAQARRFYELAIAPE